MVRLSRLTDYGIMLLTYFVREGNPSYSARELADKSGVPLPTVSKILKILARAKLVASQRGVNGGYALARRANEINMADIIEALEGPIAMTACSSEPGHMCELAHKCPTKTPWQLINQAVLKTLKNLTLADMMKSSPQSKNIRLEVLV